MSVTLQPSRHLGSSKLEAPIIACVFCGSHRWSFVLRLQSDPDVDLRECSRCFAATASRFPASDVLRDYYAAYPAHSDPAFLVGWPQRLARRLAGPVNRLVRIPRVRMLDFGGTDGRSASALALRMISAGADRIEIDIVDHIPRLIDPPSPNIVLRTAESLDSLPQNSYDVVVASAVIEHIPAAGDVLRQLLGMLGPGGSFYARTPHAVPVIKLAARFGISMDFTYPGHLHDLGQRFWENYLSQPSLLARYKTVISRPSIVETPIRSYPLRSIAAILLKLPWHVFGQRYQLVGGWEVFVQRID